MGASAYSELGLAPDATAAEVKAAYHRLVKALHPDHTRDVAAVDRLQRVNEAYAVLSHAERRSAYAEGQPSPRPRPARQARLTACTECGRQTAQPRILTFRSVISWVVWSTPSWREGIFCAACGRRGSLRASGVSVLAGWWGPLGPLLVMHALIWNAVVASRSSEADRRLALMNARSLYAAGDLRLAYAVAAKVEKGGGRVAGAAAALMAEIVGAGLGRHRVALRDPWRPTAGYLLSHLTLIFSGPLTVALAVAAGGALSAFGWI